jgi:Na+/melibiose symporter-like transporter
MSLDFLRVKWNVPLEQAGVMMAIPDIISAIGSPLGGFLLDILSKNSKRGSLRFHVLPLAGIMMIMVHCMMGFTDILPQIPLVLLGIAYSLFGAVLWPLIPQLVTRTSLLGTAYGLSTVALNMALTFVPLVIAEVYKAGSYLWVEITFVGFASFGLLSSIMTVCLYSRHVKKSYYDDLVGDDEKTSFLATHEP